MWKANSAHDPIANNISSQLILDDVPLWELLINNLSVYYDIKEDSKKMILVLDVGVRCGNEVKIGEETIILGENNGSGSLIDSPVFAIRH